MQLESRAGCLWVVWNGEGRRKGSESVCSGTVCCSRGRGSGFLDPKVEQIDTVQDFGPTLPCMRASRPNNCEGQPEEHSLTIPCGKYFLVEKA